MNTIKVAVIGTGFGQDVISVFQKLKGAEVVAIAARDEEKTKAVAEKFSVPRYYTDWKNMLDEVDIDLISIQSPNFLHKEMFEYALAKNIHILLDKPAGTTVKEIDEMIEKSKGYEKHIVINHLARFHPYIEFMRDELEKEKLGTVTAIRLAGYLPWLSTGDVDFTWALYEEHGGGIERLYVSHLIDLARFVAGMPDVKSKHIISQVIKDSKFDEQPTGATQFSGQFEFENEISVQLFANYYTQGHKDLEIQIFGTEGIIFYDSINELRVARRAGTPLVKHDIPDPLPDIQVGRSLLSKSMKYLANAYIDLINGDESKINDFCTLEAARDNLGMIL
ncbi:Gfo/Idh/MocA family oxidoreductase [Candidatus Dojkabacteria bacterium]|uniref:Gfo/Idh/MocA family oxidoreductase n=1 Tax=Candidatus Dojkabacteria bacterium TaxID=2099670 RepID=A0A955RKD8_9BACT|nr:Gfo/Idh/MocA family oxidoreductase [Candidatus Dojkabacteria bacterium]